jgi:hypothetical protein
MSQRTHAGRTGETGRRMIYEFKVLCKSKSREHLIQGTQNVSIAEITRLSKVTKRSSTVVLQVHQLIYIYVRGRVCLYVCVCVFVYVSVYACVYVGVCM